ncbi:hypothetical protein [Paludisphaera rhizosphaerae]|uniref:hypothetical protein n=1 Tax=Paludisphaera rhizosphaerae TaxID=2711216 RepID=UPI0013EC6970|nr:hypothetical protein [Paludisphaera rhizosphaerae]
MRRLRTDIKVWQLMTVVAVLASMLAAARAAGPQGFGVVIVLICIGGLTCVRYSRAVARRTSDGLATGVFQRYRILSLSALAATAIIGASDLAFIAAVKGFLKVASAIYNESHARLDGDPIILAMGTTVGLYLALSVARRLANPLGRDGRSSGRRRLAWWPVVVSLLIGLPLFAAHAREHYRSCRMESAYHGLEELKASDRKQAARHAWLRRWYESAAFQPWRPMRPDRLPPELR